MIANGRMGVQVELLAGLQLFARLPADALPTVAALATRRAFKRGEVVFHKSDPGEAVFVVLRGRAKVVLPGDSHKRVLLRVLEHGDVFGELCLFDAQPRPSTVIASEQIETLMFERRGLLKLLQTHPALAVEMLRVISQRLRDANEFIEDTIFLDVAARLAKKLLELSNAYGHDSLLGTIIALRITQLDLAAMLGVTRESVNKHLQAFRARGIIEFDRQRIVVLRPDDLQRRIY